MKRLVSLLLFFCFFLSGCSSLGEWIKEPVTFYYVNENYQEDLQQVIVSEIREASGHREDLAYLLALYSMGPASENLKSPFPRNTVILPIEHSGDKIVLSISENVLTMTDAEYTLASACIALTCMEISEVSQVTVVCGEKSTTIGKDNLLIYTGFVQKPQEEKT